VTSVRYVKIRLQPDKIVAHL